VSVAWRKKSSKNRVRTADVGQRDLAVDEPGEEVDAHGTHQGSGEGIVDERVRLA
jgi:hypothetical protein